MIAYEVFTCKGSKESVYRTFMDKKDAERCGKSLWQSIMCENKAIAEHSQLTLTKPEWIKVGVRKRGVKND